MSDVVADYVEGKYTYHDKEEEALLSEQEISKRNEREKKERQSLVDIYLPTFEVSRSKDIDVQRLKTYLNSLASWAHGHAHGLRKKPNNEG